MNHFSATEEKQAEVKARMTAAGIEPLMEIDHGWCYSLYYLDPNGIIAPGKNGIWPKAYR